MDELRSKLLTILLSSNNYVSGSSIARSLGVSRSTVNRLINELISEGYMVEKHPKMGYRLIINEDLKRMSSAGIVSDNIRYTIHYMEFCTSTQDVADMLARGGAPEGTLVLCEVMSRGRGRLGREWFASRGGLWFTLVLKPRLTKGLQLTSLAASVCVAEAIQRICGLKASVKWPNDVLVNDRKVAGILTEGKLEAYGVGYLLVGVGINVNNDLPDFLRNQAITLKDLLGYIVPRAPILKAFIECFSRMYNRLLANDVDYVIDRWRSLNSTLGRMVRVYTFEGVIEGIAKDLDREGALNVETSSGLIRVLVGDVVHVR